MENEKIEQNENRWEMIHHHSDNLIEVKFEDSKDVMCVIENATNDIKLIVKGEVVNKFNYVEKFGGVGANPESSEFEAWLRLVSKTIQNQLIFI
ncbi:MAG: hypothetical protein M0Q14_11080 [Tissierellaceae bacterium]|nr:hypothetical protein [Tissierellaceae bacterium]